VQGGCPKATLLIPAPILGFEKTYNIHVLVNNLNADILCNYILSFFSNVVQGRYPKGTLLIPAPLLDNHNFTIINKHIQLLYMLYISIIKFV